MYSQKIKFDKKCEDSKQPRETMEQFLSSYFSQKYGLKSIVAEQVKAVVAAV